MIKNKIYLLLVLTSFTALSQNPPKYKEGLRLPNATEDVNPLRLPVIDSNGLLNEYITTNTLFGNFTETDPLRKFVDGTNPLDAVYNDGKVGILNTNPESLLTIGNSANINKIFNIDGLYSKVLFSANAGEYPSQQGIWNFINTGTSGVTRLYIQDANNSNGRLTFDFRGGNGTSKIIAGTSSGKIGIGTTAPSSNLDVVGNGSYTEGIVVNSARYNNISITNKSKTDAWAIRSDSNNLNFSGLYFTSTDDADFYLRDNLGSINAKISSNGNSYFANGNVGIGTTTPTKTLDVNGELRVRTLPIGAATDDILTTDTNGNIRKIGDLSSQFIPFTGNTPTNPITGDLHFLKTNGQTLSVSPSGIVFGSQGSSTGQGDSYINPRYLAIGNGNSIGLINAYSLTSSREYALPDKDGTFALLSDIKDSPLEEDLGISGNKDINWENEVHNISIIGTTTLFDDNLPTGDNTKTIKLFITGDFSLNFPASWSTFRPIIGTYDGTLINEIEVTYIKANTYFVKITN